MFFFVVVVVPERTLGAFIHDGSLNVLMRF